MKCGSIISKCRKCGFENKDRLETCPECGEDMHCQNESVVGYPKCSNHGGPAPRRNFYGRGTMTTGSGSSFALTRLAAKYNQMMTNGQVLSNRAAIEIVDSRITQLLERIDFDEAPDRVARLYELWTAFTTEENGAEKIALEKKISDEFEKVYHDYKAWEQIFAALDLRGKSVEREVKVLKEIKAIMTAEDGYELAAKLLGAVMRVIGDEPKKLKQVQYEFTRIIGQSSDLVIEGHGEDDGGGSEEGGGET